jgi:hypothetical protein
VITLKQRESDSNNQMITIINCLLIQSTFLLVILDWVNLGQFDHINGVITIYVTTLTLYLKTVLLKDISFRSDESNCLDLDDGWSYDIFQDCER